MDEVNYLEPTIADEATGGMHGKLDLATMMSCLDFLFNAAVEQRMPLAATLTIPQAPGTYPAVILISGSGPQDRDETLIAKAGWWPPSSPPTGMMLLSSS